MQTINTYQSQNWTNALYLHERNHIDVDQLPIDTEKIHKWRLRSTDLIEIEIWKQRASEDGLTTDQMKRLISTPSLSMRLNPSPNWLQFLDNTFKGEYSLKLNATDISEKTRNLPFFEFTIPFLEHIKCKIKEKYHQYSNEIQSSIDLSILIPSLLEPISNQLLKIANKTLIYEINKKRIEQNLHGSTKEERYQYFVKTYFENYQNLYSLLSNYPVLGRLISETTEFLYKAIFGALDDWSTDREAIQHQFLGEIQLITGITIMGDVHNSGKSVLKFTFNENSALIYKPHSLSVDIHFQQLLEWINEREEKNNYFSALNILDCGDHGWVEFIHQKPCSSRQEVERFYNRQGRYLAILHILNATDFHQENIIACGEHPYLIDLESLFQYRIFDQTTHSTATQKATELINHSVISTALLPVRINNPRFMEVNFSGLGSNTGLINAFIIENSHTDEMRMTKKMLSIKPETSHQPLFKGEPIGYESYTSQIISGFKEMYEFFIKEKESLLSENGPISIFKNDQIRIILRPTYFYGRVLEASKHPKYLTNGIDRVYLLDLLWKGNNSIPSMYKVIASECRDLLQEDIPYFMTTVNSKDLYDQREKQIKNYFDTTPLEKVMNKINNISYDNLEKQVEFITASFYANQPEKEVSKEGELFQQVQDHLSKLEVEQIRSLSYQEAVRIGKELADLAIWSNNKKTVTWLSMGLTRYGNLEYSVMKLSLYSGILGMALYYGYLYQLSKDLQFKKICEACINTAFKDYLHKDIIDVEDHSAFFGYAGAVYVFMHLHSILDRPDLIDEANNLLVKIERLIDLDTQYDLLSGNAGVIPICLDYYKMTGNKKALEIATRCGDYLVNKAYKDGDLCYWITKDPTIEKPPLTGFSHGAAGIAWSLSYLYEVTKKTEYLECAIGAVRYENSVFDVNQQNWANYSNTTRMNQEKTFSYSWCNGATGIGLSRLEMIGKSPYSTAIQDNLNAAVNTVYKHGLSKPSHCLCHGQMGSLEFLFRAALKQKDDELLSQVYQHLLVLLKQTSTNQWWECGFAGKYITPNLMVGLAGVGYQLLRFYQPQTPSILTLEPPIELRENYHYE